MPRKVLEKIRTNLPIRRNTFALISCCAVSMFKDHDSNIDLMHFLRAQKILW